MKALRIILLASLGLMALLMHDLLATLIEQVLQPMRRGMLFFGLYLHIAGWGFAIGLPLCIGLGELWWSGMKRYLPHLLLLIALCIWSMYGASTPTAPSCSSSAPS